MFTQLLSIYKDTVLSSDVDSGRVVVSLNNEYYGGWRYERRKCRVFVAYFSEEVERLL